MWATVCLDIDAHVIPLDDLKEHVLHKTCWCHPVEDEEDCLWLHIAMDLREQFETGERTPS